MPGLARLITLNLGSQTIGLAEFRVAHGGLILVNYHHAEFILSEVEGLEMTDILFVGVLSVKSV